MSSATIIIPIGTASNHSVGGSVYLDHGFEPILSWARYLYPALELEIKNAKKSAAHRDQHKE